MSRHSVMCTKCDSTWNLETKENSALSNCPICGFREINELNGKISELKKKLECYRTVFQDIGVDSVKTND